ncbi:unnamed protein product [Choristocarpus tenellus]
MLSPSDARPIPSPQGRKMMKESPLSRQHILAELASFVLPVSAGIAVGGLRADAVEEVPKTCGLFCLFILCLLVRLNLRMLRLSCCYPPNTCHDQPRVEWISGKSAQVKGSDDKTGTKKETKYLRCLSNCLADCQKPTYGPEKDREECLQQCQDECCSTYEQCTYTVTQNR